MTKTLKKIIKILKEISYSKLLTLSTSYISPGNQSANKNINYELISIIIHKGKQASEGHYITFCKDKESHWWYLDDKKVIKVIEDSFLSYRPYILFYRRINKY